jgi:phosphomannomutase
MKSWRAKELIVFDLDGTLTETKSNLEPYMSRVLVTLLKSKKVAVIGGGTYRQFKKQFVSRLTCPPALLTRLFLFPTTATSFYRYHGGWKKVYALELSKKARQQVKQAFRDVLREIHYVRPQKVYGKVLEDRGSQMTFSALGQDIVARLGKKGVQMKKEWTQKNTPLKFKITKLVARRLPGLEVRASGFTSIDVTRKGIDKEYGVRQIEKYLHMPIRKMLFVGDALFPGGNDYAAKRTGVECVAVRGPHDTKKIIKNILKSA